MYGYGYGRVDNGNGIFFSAVIMIFYWYMSMVVMKIEK